MINMILLASSVIFAIGMSYLAYASYLNGFLKLIALPIALAITVSSIKLYYESLGKPNSFGLPEKAEYIAHRITNQDEIVVWLITEKQGDRLYIIPYNRENAKKLQEAEEAKGKGGAESNETSVIILIDSAGDIISVEEGEAPDVNNQQQSKPTS